MLDLNKLEQLVKTTTSGSWWASKYGIYKSTQSDDVFVGQISESTDSDYIIAACNSMPELIAENKALQERAQMRQELVEQYEQDIARLRQKIRKLEQQKNWLAKKCENLYKDSGDHFLPCTIPTTVWIKRAEQATKEN